MATRRVIDAEQNGEKVYVKGHALATYMSDGTSVEEAVNNRVTKVDGKQLSTEDFTTILKNKLDGLSNYDDTTISEAVEKLRTDFDTLVSGDTAAAIESFNEIIDFLDGIEDSTDLNSIIASIEQQIAAKGTVTSITAGEGLTGGTITGEGTIALEKLHSSNKSITFLPFEKNGLVVGSSLSLNKAPVTENSMVYSIDCDKNGRITYLSRTYQTESRTFYNIEEATKSLAGFMTAEDKTKLDGIDMTTKQDTLVSGTNIKTINGESILGSGDITISEGSSNSRKEVVYEIAQNEVVITAMRPNVIYWIDGVENFTIDSFEEPLQDVDSYDIFTAVIDLSAATEGIAVSLTLPDDVLWANGEMPDLTNGSFELSISRISDGYDSKYFAVLTPFKEFS